MKNAVKNAVTRVAKPAAKPAAKPVAKPVAKPAAKSIARVALAALLGVACAWAGGDDLSDAVRKNDLPRAKKLIEAGADVNAVSEGATPAGWAIAYDASGAMIDLLLDHGATVPITDTSKAWSQPSAMLVGAASLGRTEIAAALIRRGAEVSATGSNDTSPLHFAARGGHLGVLRLLLDKGASVSATAANGTTPLATALLAGQAAAANLLAHSAGMTLHRAEGRICLSAPALAPVLGPLAPSRLWLGDDAPPVPAMLDRSTGTGSMSPTEFSGVVALPGGVMAKGAFDYGADGVACLLKGGFLVLPEGVKAEAIDPGLRELLDRAARGDADARVDLVIHDAAQGDTARARDAGATGAIRIEPLAPLPPQDSLHAQSANARHFAYVVPRSSWKAVVIDGADPGPEFDTITDLVTSDDGQHVGYGATRSGEEFVVFDGRRGPTFEGVASPILCGNATRTAYRAVRGGKTLPVIDGKPGPAYDAVGSIVFSEDCKHVAYSAKQGEKMFFVVDGKQGPQHDGIIGNPGATSFSRDGRRFVYAAIEDGKYRVVVDGKPGPPCTEFNSLPVVSRDGAHVAYSAVCDGRGTLFVDGVPQTAHERYGMLAYSPSGTRFAYAAIEGGKVMMIVDGKAHARHDRVSTAAFSADGLHVAYGAQDGAAAFVVADGKASPTYPFVVEDSVRYTRDGRSLAYLVANDDRSFSLVVDGRVGPRFDGMLPGSPVTLANGDIEYLAAKDGMLLRVRHVRPPAPAAAPGTSPRPGTKR